MISPNVDKSSFREKNIINIDPKFVELTADVVRIID